MIKFWFEYISLIFGPILYLYFLNSIFALKIPKKALTSFLSLSLITALYVTVSDPIEYSQYLYLFQLFASFMSITIVIVMIYSMQKGRSGAGYTFFASLILTASLAYDIGVSSGFLPYPYTLQYALCYFIFMHALVVAKVFKSLTEQNKHAFNELKKIVYQHQLLQIRQGIRLEQTMPTFQTQACVLSFDIIGSSKIKHINSKKFFRNVFSRCNEVMALGYDGVKLKANAYRIKEMGDGFLCSVGYPFESVTENAANDSVDLAKKFAHVLAEESTMLYSESPVCCGIGIALDSITGFYPESGAMDYDVYGYAIVLATRYESMRKTLFEGEKNRSILIIQELVFRSLDPSHRIGFTEMDLQKIGVVVRDDPAATKLYYQFL